MTERLERMGVTRSTFSTKRRDGQERSDAAYHRELEQRLDNAARRRMDELADAIFGAAPEVPFIDQAAAALEMDRAVARQRRELLAQVDAAVAAAPPPQAPPPGPVFTVPQDERAVGGMVVRRVF